MVALIIHPLAHCDREAALFFYGRRNEEVARRFDSELERAWLRIQEQPETWPVVEHGLRRCLFDHFPYAVIYRLTNQTAYVVTVAHLSRKPDYWLDRLQDIP